MQDTIRKGLDKDGIPAEVEGRIKRLYSIHQKAQRQKRTLDQVYDLLAVRIVTDSVRNCYAALGVVHQIWRPVPGRFKDYIAMPPPKSVSVAAHHRDSRRAIVRSDKSAPTRCIASPNRVSRRTGATNMARPPPKAKISAWCGCGN